MAPGHPRTTSGVPALRPGLVVRRAALDALTRSADVPHLHVGAPAGYGKTTVVRQLVEEDDRSVAWVTLDRSDDDPVRFHHCVAKALDRLAPLPGEVLAGPRERRDVHGAISMLCRMLAYREPFVLVLDDLHLLGDDVVEGCLRPLLAGIPAGTQVVLVGRGTRSAHLACLDGDGRDRCIGTAELAMSHDEVAQLLRYCGLAPTPRVVAGLREATEGWPTGVRLAALAALDGVPLDGVPPDRGARLRGARIDAGGPWDGQDRLVAEYLHAEVLDGVPADVASFLMRTSVLDELSGPLCDSVLETTGSGRRLRELEASGLFLVPVDAERRRYRYHRQFAATLRSELLARDPSLGERLRRRASRWHDCQPRVAATTDHQGAASPVAPHPGQDGHPGLTPAELRVLDLLPTHLSMAAIGESLFLSHNTVKSHVIAVYRKLGATSRGEAVDVARDLGLLEP